MEYVFERPGFSDWTVIVKSRDLDKTGEQKKIEPFGSFDEFDVSFRTGTFRGKEAEKFTLMYRDNNFALIWIDILKNGDVEYVAHIPSVITTVKKIKTIEIRILGYCRYVEEIKLFEFDYLPEYNSDFKIAINL